jgi:2'-5' RNA ligase
MLPAPASPEYKAFQTIIDDLASKDGKHTFHPHVTVAVLNASTPPAQIAQVLEELKAEFFATRFEFEKFDFK